MTVDACATCGHPPHKAECYDCIRYDLREVCTAYLPPRPVPEEADAETVEELRELWNRARDDRDDAIALMSDLMLKTPSAGEDQDGFILGYILPTGPLHRIAGYLTQHGQSFPQARHYADERFAPATIPAPHAEAEAGRYVDAVDIAWQGWKEQNPDKANHVTRRTLFADGFIAGYLRGRGDRAVADDGIKLTDDDEAAQAWNEWLRRRPIAPNQREVFTAGYQAVLKDRDDWIARHGTIDELRIKAEAELAAADARESEGWASYAAEQERNAALSARLERVRALAEKWEQHSLPAGRVSTWTVGECYEKPCAHWFQRERLWGNKRWKCEKCGFQTRRYDSVDFRMTRPLHPYMSVAVPGYNAGKPDQ